MDIHKNLPILCHTQKIDYPPIYIAELYPLTVILSFGAYGHIPSECKCAE